MDYRTQQRRAGDFPPRRIAEYSPQKLLEVADDSKSGVTLIIFGGGASQAPGTNIKLAAEAEQSLRQVYDRGQPIPNIKRILIVSNPSGSTREENHLDKDDFSTSAKLVSQALAKLRVDEQKDTVVMGFSAGGNLALQLASKFEEDRQTTPNEASTNLVLIETTGTVKNSPSRMTFEFLIGDMLRNYKRYRAQKAEKSGAKAREDYRIGWATMDGVPTWRDIFREVMAPHARHQKYAQAFGLEKLADQKANLGILSQANAVEAMDKIKGRLIVMRSLW